MLVNHSQMFLNAFNLTSIDSSKNTPIYETP